MHELFFFSMSSTHPDVRGVFKKFIAKLWRSMRILTIRTSGNNTVFKTLCYNWPWSWCFMCLWLFMVRESMFACNKISHIIFNFFDIHPNPFLDPLFADETKVPPHWLLRAWLRMSVMAVLETSPVSLLQILLCKPSPENCVIGRCLITFVFRLFHGQIWTFWTPLIFHHGSPE